MQPEGETEPTVWLLFVFVVIVVYVTAACVNGTKPSHAGDGGQALWTWAPGIFLWTDFLRENIFICHKTNVGEFIPPLILFPSRKNMKWFRLRGGGGGHLCFTSASCYVAPYLGLQRALLPSHKSLHRGLLVIKHVLHSVPLSGEQRWKYIVILWPGFKKQCSIHPSIHQHVINHIVFFYLESYLLTLQS